MKNIEKIKLEYFKKISLVYYKKKIDQLTETERNKCLSVSEYKAYVDSVIPKGYDKFNIFDFDGTVKGKNGESFSNTSDSEIILEAKDKICKYCWDLSWEKIKEEKNNKDKNINEFLRKNNVMDSRRKEGANVVIFGLSSKPIGRTMIASIIMKEAIRLRLTKNKRGQTYDWVDMDVLISSIGNRDERVSDYLYADWLVIDNIVDKPRSEKQTLWINDNLNSFLFSRNAANLVNIFVFKYDIKEKMSAIENIFGTTIVSMINSKNTMRISLS